MERTQEARQRQLREDFEHLCRPYCFMCEYGNRVYDGSDIGCRPYVKLLNLFRDNFNRVCNRSMGILLARYYFIHIFQPSMDEDGHSPLPFMTPELMEKHFFCHELNPAVALANDLRTLNDAIVATRLHLVDPHTDKPDRYMAETLSKLINTRWKVFGVNPAKVAFGSAQTEGIQIDMEAAGSIGNLRRVRPILQLGANTLGSDSTTTVRPRDFNAPAPGDTPPEFPWEVDHQPQERLPV
jgi:hypothetical protein